MYWYVVVCIGTSYVGMYVCMYECMYVCMYVLFLHAFSAVLLCYANICLKFIASHGPSTGLVPRAAVTGLTHKPGEGLFIRPGEDVASAFRASEVGTVKFQAWLRTLLGRH